MPPPIFFPASLDRLGLVISAATALLVASAIYTLYDRRELLGAGTWIIAGLVFGSLLLGWLMRPTGYALTDDELVIGRFINPRRLPLKEIESAMRVTENDTGAQIREFGSGGFGGYFGLFRSSKLGRLDYYVTDMSKRVLIEPRDGRKLVVSPDDPDAFERTLRARLPRA